MTLSLCIKIFILIITLIALAFTNVSKCKTMDTFTIETSLKTSSSFLELSVYYQYKQCSNCQNIWLYNVNSSSKAVASLSSNYDYNFMVKSILNDKKRIICEEFEHLAFGECGRYELGKI